MNEETISVPIETSSLEAQETIAPTSDRAVTLEELAGAEETVPMTTVPVITIEEIQTIGSDLMHVDLFGSFLICGTLIGLFLLRGIHGT